MIEDDKELCKAVKLQLDASGYETDLCHDGNDALYYGLQPVYDLIILDRMLPGVDGLSILKLLRENQIHTPIIMATAMDAVSQRIAGLDCGADDYIETLRCRRTSGTDTCSYKTPCSHGRKQKSYF